MKMNIGSNIRRLRLIKNVTQEQLSIAMNVSSAAVSKWERGDTYPDITLLQPLAYYFGVTLDELMGYDQEKIRSEVETIIDSFKRHQNDEEGLRIISDAYNSYPNDHRIMYYYMWAIVGGTADNDSRVLIDNKDELLSICEKLLDSCTDEELRLGAWNMRAKILYAEGKNAEALEIYHNRFTDWFSTGEQKIEQLFAKTTREYYTQVKKNMYILAGFSADKLGRVVVFDSSLSMEERKERALHYGDVLINAFETTGEAFFLIVARAFLGRVENDFCHRGGTDGQVCSVMDKNFYVIHLLDKLMEHNETLRCSVECYLKKTEESLLEFELNCRLNATECRRKELLKNTVYDSILKKYS